MKISTSQVDYDADCSVSTVKRLPYADYIAVLGEDGRVSECGAFQDLTQEEGYVASFSLPAADWDYIPEASIEVKSSQTDFSSIQKSEWDEDDLHKRTGDLSTYLFYIRSIGWIPTASFLIAISGFAFCISFPSWFPPLHFNPRMLCH